MTSDGAAVIRGRGANQQSPGGSGQGDGLTQWPSTGGSNQDWQILAV
ncbi:hypothetical protein ABZ499_32655 [Streptomyces sp. NPDC019990]